MFPVWLALLLSFQVATVNASNILISFAHDFDSHINSMKPFFMRLSEAGHNITVLDTSARDKPRYFGPTINVFHIQVSVPNIIPPDIFWKIETTSAKMPSLFAESDVVFGEILDENNKASYFNPWDNTYIPLFIFNSQIRMYPNLKLCIPATNHSEHEMGPYRHGRTVRSTF
uniref:Glucuronosyltransferase n=1 Tax=Steinernema glaseri TaxID=37863 RepID=A0A1I8AVA4_9BILA